ncbi:MAG: L,D-transpeptidase family protein [Clostridium sp.]
MAEKFYKTNGSHGCINLPPAVAKTVYENISAGMPVLCYHLQGSGSGNNQHHSPEWRRVSSRDEATADSAGTDEYGERTGKHA